MPGKELLLKLTAEQQSQIKEATGKNVSQLTIVFGAAGDDLSQLDLNQVVGGVENPTTIGSATGGAGAGKIKFNEF